MGKHVEDDVKMRNRNFRCSDLQWAQLTAIGKLASPELSPSWVLRRAIVEFLARHPIKTDANS